MSGNKYWVILILITNSITSSANFITQVKNLQVLGDTTVMAVVNNSMNNNTFLKALTDIKKFPIPQNQRNSLEMQMHLTFSSFLSNNRYYKELIEESEKGFIPKDSILNIIKNGTVVEDQVFKKILEKAKNTNLIMFNENHYYPQHRIFIWEMLPKLRELGYTYLALEGLYLQQDSLLNLQNGYPTIQTGFYTREQNFVNLIREAKKLGFTFVAYENQDSKKDREIGQAENLYSKTFAVNKNAKVVVLAGIDHILERPTLSGKRWLANILIEDYKLNPLTISQTHFNIYRKYNTAKYQLLSSANFNALNNMPSVDYFLLNNRLDNDLIWESLFTYENKQIEEVQLSVFYLKEIKNENDFHKNLPYYTAIIASGEKAEFPYNKDQPFLLVIYDRSGNVLHKKSHVFNKE